MLTGDPLLETLKELWSLSQNEILEGCGYIPVNSKKISNLEQFN